MYKTFLILCILFVGGCSFIDVDDYYDTSTESQRYESAKGYTVTTTDALASCFTYALVDKNGNKMNLPDEVQENLYCFPPSISPSNIEMVISNGEELLIYTFATEMYTSILDMSSYEGVSIVGWNPEGTSLVVVVVDQANIETLTRLVIFEKVDEIWKESATHDVKINMVCGSVCAPGPDDVYLLDDHRVEYRTWDQVPYDLEDNDAIRIFNL